MAVDRLYRAEIRIAADQVGAGGVSDYSVTITQDCFIANCSEFLDADGDKAPQADLGDVIFSLDEAGDNRLAVDIIKAALDNNPALSELQLSYGTTALSASSLNVFYVHWGHASNQSQPAAGDTYGQYAAYEDDLLAYYPLNEDPSGTSPQMRDRSINANHGTSNGSMTSGDVVSGKVGNALDFDGTDDYLLGSSSLGISGDAEFSMMAWIKGHVWPGQWPSFMGNNTISQTNRGLSFTMNSGRPAIDFWNNRYRAFDAVPTNQWLHICGTKEPGLIHDTSTIFVDGVVVNGGYETANVSPDVLDSRPVVGRLDHQSQRYFDGLIDEVRFYTRALLQADITTGYNNTDAPGTFAVAQAVQTVGGSAFPFFRLCPLAGGLSC